MEDCTEVRRSVGAAQFAVDVFQSLYLREKKWKSKLVGLKRKAGSERIGQPVGRTANGTCGARELGTTTWKPTAWCRLEQ